MANVIAIDGPSGAGKSSVSKIVGSRLGYLHVDSGALYRSLSPEVAGRLAAATNQVLEKKNPIEFRFTLNTPGGRAVPLDMKTDFVCDKNTPVDFICTFREA